jgi:UDP-N-acetylglucosamine 4-epimerase
MNELAMTTETQLLNTVYNTAFGDRNTLNDLNYLKEYLANTILQ